jgi:hypothetical protein
MAMARFGQEECLTACHETGVIPAIERRGTFNLTHPAPDL